MKCLDVKMPDGSMWTVPADYIARHRATEICADDKETTFDEEVDFALEDAFELKDWAANNMNWTDVAHLARKVMDPGPMSPDDFQEGWVNGDKTISERAF